ncbi:PREDICTED: putative B3 domain-containing protein At1g78640 [Tarenaya hassleriana]|uniref:putative B3 domain-containing protein At1g78640 n=1 Tax=Tarenaya hassleriana TaxID=28532 RepID=UPI0008FD7DFE|nr:PREDICTED: putative B3 domain-containing protein At1g78640 [Tarenaya hassleriana]
MKIPQASSLTTTLDRDAFPANSPSSESDNPQVEPSTDLCLLDKTWTISPAVSSPARNLKPWPARNRVVENAQEVWTELTLFLDPWKIKKHLVKSDVGNQCRLLLPTKTAMVHILPYLPAHESALLDQGQGIYVKVFDLDTELTHRLVLKRWITRSYVFIGNWHKEFVNSRNLREGDEIGLFWDQYTSRLIFRVLSRANALQNLN